MNNTQVNGWAEYFTHVMSKVNNKSGTFVELGFGLGTSANLIVNLMNRGVLDKRDIWLFDSFEGFPEPTEEDRRHPSYNRNAVKGEWKVPIEPALEIADKISTNVQVTKGFVEDTLPHSYHGGDIAILHIDLDLYSAYKTTLDSLYSKVIKGGVILFDEYKSPIQYKNFPGASIAVDEFFEQQGINPNIEMATFSNGATQKFFMVKG